MSFYNHLDNFLKQAHTEDLTTNHFIKDYLDTKVTVSFGKGNIARIPWISFLIKPNITSKGDLSCISLLQRSWNSNSCLWD